MDEFDLLRDVIRFLEMGLIANPADSEDVQRLACQIYGDYGDQSINRAISLIRQIHGMTDQSPEEETNHD